MTLHTPSCPVCHGRPVRVRDRHGYHHCRHCGFWLLHPQPSEADLKAIYSSGYYASWGSAEEGGVPVYWNLKKDLFRRLLHQAGPLPRGGRALDIGCATGACLSVLGELGFEAHGVDVNPHAIEVAARLVPEARMVCGWLESSELAPASFDLVVMSDVIEHSRDPWNFVRAVRSLLRPHGRVVVLTPDIGSLSSAVMRDAWPHLKKEHLFLFDRAGLARLVRNCGLTVLKVKAAAKPLSLHYAAHQFDAYPHALASPVLRTLRRTLPGRVMHRTVPIPMGEMLLVAERAGAIGS